MLHLSWFEKEQEDIHINILRYALKNPGFTHNDLINEFSFNQEVKIFVGSEISHDGNFFTYVGTDNTHGYKFMLSFEGRSRLLEYDELKEARQNSKQAFRLSILALLISIVGVIIQITNGN